MSSKAAHNRPTKKPVRKPVKKRKAPNQAREKRFPIRMRSAVFEAGQRAAGADNRSLASLMEMLLIIHLQERGFLPKDETLERSATGYVSARATLRKAGA